MKVSSMLVLCAAALASTAVFAEGKTRAQVYQELIEAQQNGLDFVTDTSYPDVNPIFANVVAQRKQQRLAQQPQAAPGVANRATSDEASQ
ncbi:DUF4148 domain-containing protein [Paraburkholderia kururiensis]|uniref:DUF4148 domain-containing protein n=1 Tax=Paraburkholderia kururiensis TaxID=984307 RepID=UPI00034B58CB|nr:DUF4148 domain-containing protein [Paraburkholderia kururiensis]